MCIYAHFKTLPQMCVCTLTHTNMYNIFFKVPLPEWRSCISLFQTCISISRFSCNFDAASNCSYRMGSSALAPPSCQVDNDKGM